MKRTKVWKERNTKNKRKIEEKRHERKEMEIRREK